MAEGRRHKRGARASRTSAPRLRSDEGAALIEFAILLPFLAIVVFGTVDVARAWQLKNRLTNTAREGAAFAQFQPEYVGTLASPGACNGGRNVAARVLAEDPELNLASNALVVERKVSATDAVTAYTGCGTTSPSIDFTAARAADDEVVVTVSETFTVLTPLVAVVVGEEVSISGSSEVVLQG